MADDEFAIIDRYFFRIGWQSPGTVITGPGDDCAVLSMPPGYELCVSTDTLVSGVHFPARSNGTVVAARSFAAAVSDLAAMGADPYGFTGALTMPEVDHDWLSDFSTRLSELSIAFKLPLVGGNLTKGPLSLTFTVLGIVPQGEALKRDGAVPGDDIYVTGNPGDAGAGLLALMDGKANCVSLVDCYLFPKPRIEMGLRLRSIASAVIDISDGLLADLGHLVKCSDVGAEIDITKLPLSREILEFTSREKAISLALTAGDDYELCFCATASTRSQIGALRESDSHVITRIGCITPGQGVSLIDDKGKFEMTGTGYKHF